MGCVLMKMPLFQHPATTSTTDMFVEMSVAREKDLMVETAKEDKVMRPPISRLRFSVFQPVIVWMN